MIFVIGFFLVSDITAESLGGSERICNILSDSNFQINWFGHAPFTFQGPLMGFGAIYGVIFCLQLCCWYSPVKEGVVLRMNNEDGIETSSYESQNENSGQLLKALKTFMKVLVYGFFLSILYALGLSIYYYVRIFVAFLRPEQQSGLFSYYSKSGYPVLSGTFLSAFLNVLGEASILLVSSVVYE